MIGQMNHKEYAESLGRKIKLYRVGLGMSQQDLADKTGVSVRSISRLEQGSTIQLDNLIKILIALGLGNNIDLLVPDQTKRPSYHLANPQNKSQRVKKRKEKSTFHWGDEA